jgi:hypothetical protein
MVGGAGTQAPQEEREALWTDIAPRAPAPRPTPTHTHPTPRPRCLWPCRSRTALAHAPAGKSWMRRVSQSRQAQQWHVSSSTSAKESMRRALWLNSRRMPAGRGGRGGRVRYCKQWHKEPALQPQKHKTEGMQHTG